MVGKGIAGDQRRATQDARCHREGERPGREVKAPATHHPEAGRFDRRERVAVRMAAAHQPWPDVVDSVLPARPRGFASPHVLVEAQLTSRPHHAAQVTQRDLLVRNRTEHAREHRRVEGGLLEWKLTGKAVEHPDLERQPGCGLDSPRA
jgi:hypothetical protein